MNDILILLISGVFLFLWEFLGCKLIDKFAKNEDTIILSFVVIISILYMIIIWTYLTFIYIIF